MGLLPAALGGSRPVYLIDVEAYKPPDEYKVDMAECFRIWGDEKVYDAEEVRFLRRIHDRSGLAVDSTYLPPAIHPKFCGAHPTQSLNDAKAECQMAVFTAVQGLLEKTGLRADEVDILVTTCSIYCPTPSMASLVVNHFKMRSDVQSYHLGGMGCSNGAVGINLIHDLLQAQPGKTALFVTTETTSGAYYLGHERARQVTNVLFRMGAAAVLLSNDAAAWRGRIKYKLLHHERVQLAASDEAYNCIHYSPDAAGKTGIFLGKNVVDEASRALKIAMRRLGYRILTWRQVAEYVAHCVRMRLSSEDEREAAPPYVPAFGDSVQHFLIHAGGAKVLGGIGKALKLPAACLAPSNAVLHDYGNVSSSTTWYTLAYVETVQGVAAGDKLLQIGVGSGVKCGVNVWQAQKNVRAIHGAWEHRLSPEEAAAARKVIARDRRRSWQDVLLRVVTILFLLLAVGVLQLRFGGGGRTPFGSKEL